MNESKKETDIRSFLKEMSSHMKEEIARTTKYLDVLEILSEDENRFVREQVPKNPIITLEITEKLFNDKSREVRWSVIRFSPCVTHEMLEKAANDKYWDVSEQARRRMAHET